MIKKLLILFLLISLSFAATWQVTTSLAVFASLLILIVIYIIGFGFGIENMKFLATQELYQLVITVILAGLIVGSATYMDEFSGNFGSYVSETGSPSLYEVTTQRIADVNSKLTVVYIQVAGFTESAAHQSTKTFYCSFISTGFFLSMCNSYSMVLPPLSMAFQAFSVAFTELQSLQTLMDLGYQFSFSLFLPLGIFLRSFKITRGGGGFFIALGIVFYLILPLSYVFLTDMVDYYELTAGDTVAEKLKTDPSLPVPTACKPQDTSDNGMGNADNVKGVLPGIFDNLEIYVYYILVVVNIPIIITILILITALRWLTSLMGAEVDLSALSRIA